MRFEWDCFLRFQDFSNCKNQQNYSTMSNQQDRNHRGTLNACIVFCVEVCYVENPKLPLAFIYRVFVLNA